MYKFKDNQLSLTDFGAAAGLKLNPENHWIKKAQSIPWDEIGVRYAKFFTNRKGNVAKPLWLALGACITQAEYGFSDEETALQTQEGPYLQYFCGYREYDDLKPPFDPSLRKIQHALLQALLNSLSARGFVRNFAFVQ